MKPRRLFLPTVVNVTAMIQILISHQTITVAGGGTHFIYKKRSIKEISIPRWPTPRSGLLISIQLPQTHSPVRNSGWYI